MAEELIIERVENTLNVIKPNNTKIVEIAQGLPGKGVPAMGSEKQYLRKVSDLDYDTEWADLIATDVSIDPITDFSGTNVQNSIELLSSNELRATAPVNVNGSGNNKGLNTVYLDMDSVDAELVLQLTDKLLIQRGSLVKSVTYDQISGKGDTYLRGVVNLVGSGNSGTVTGDPLNASIQEGVAPTVNPDEPLIGVHYIVENASVISSITGELLTYLEGDYVEWTGSTWTRIIRTLDEYVESFNGRTAVVTPQAGDYSADQVTNAADKSADNTFNENIIIAKTLTVIGDAILSSVEGVKLPTGSTVQRPSLPTVGYFRFNTDSSTVEVYTGLQWVSIDPLLLEASTQAVADDLALVEARVTANETAIGNININITGITGDVAQNTSDIAGLRTDVDQNTLDIQTVDGKADSNTGLIGGLDIRVTQSELDIITVDGKADQNAVDIIINEADIAANKLDIDANTAAVTAVDLKADGIDTDLQATKVRVTNNEIAIGNNLSEITILQNRVTTNEGDIDALEAADVVFDGRITQNTNDIIQTNANINAVEQRVSVNEIDITALDVRVTQNEIDIAAIEELPASLQAQITQNANDIAINSADITTNSVNISTNVANIATNTSDITDLQNDKLAKSDPTVDAEVKTIKVNESTDLASNLGAGSIKWNSGTQKLEYSDGTLWQPVGSGEGGGGVTVYQGDKLPVGSSMAFHTYKDRLGDGFLPWAFDNAVLKAAYPDLYAEVGDIFEQMHLDAGDPASGADSFYPTPVPGKYGRSGIPDEVVTDVDVIDQGGNLNIQVPNFKDNFRNGTPLKFVVITGTAPTGLVDGAVYYCRFGVSTVNFAPTESDAIANTNKIPYTDSGSGTFRLTQEGVGIGDATNNSNSDLGIQAGSGSGPSNNKYLSVSGAGNVSVITGASSSTAIAGTPSNETRPDSVYLFYYTKAFNTVANPVVVTADTDWHISGKVEYTGEAPIPTELLELTDTNQLLNIADYPKLYAKLGVKYGGDDITTFALPTIAQAGFDNYWDEKLTGNAAPVTNIWGDGIFLVTGSRVGGAEHSVIIDTTTGNDFEQIVFQSSSGTTIFLRVKYAQGTSEFSYVEGGGYTGVFTSIKKLEVPENVTPCIYVGNGGQYSVEDTGLDYRVTKLENTLALSDPYETKWTLETSGVSGKKYTINHRKGVGITKLDIQVWWSLTGSDSDAFQSKDLNILYDHATPSTIVEYTGIEVRAIDDNNIELAIGREGFYYMRESDGAFIRHTGNDIYYKVIVTERASAPLISAYNAFINKKDWVEVWSGSSTALIPNEWGEGIFRLTFQASGDSSKVIGEIPVTFGEFAETLSGRDVSVNVRGTYHGSGNYFNTFEEDGDGTAGTIFKIEKWQDTTGADKPSVALDDGWETIWNGTPKTTVLNTELSTSLTIGNYEVLANVTLSGVTRTIVGYISIDDTTVQSYAPSATGIGTSSDSWEIVYRGDQSYFTIGVAGGFSNPLIRRIRKFKGVMTLDLNITRARSSGSVNWWNRSLTPTPGQDYDASGDIPVHAVLNEGDKLTVKNTAPSGSTDLVTGLPGGHSIQAQESITYTYAYAESLWFIDNSAILEAYKPVKDWVEVWSNLTNVSNTTTEKVDPGLYKVRIGRTSNDFFTTIVAIEDNINQYANSWAAGNNLTYVNGEWNTNLAGYGIQRIEKWQDVYGYDAPSVPIDDGWEEVYYSDFASGVTQLSQENWYTGEGKYRITATDSDVSTRVKMHHDFEAKGDERYIGALYAQDGVSPSDTYTFLLTENQDLWLTGNTSYRIHKVEKWKGSMSVNLYTTREQVEGTPVFTELVLGAAGDETATLPSAPTSGDKLTIFNASTHANGYKVTTGIGSIVLGPQCEITFTWRTTQNQWTYDKGTLIDQYTKLHDGATQNVEKYAGGKMRNYVSNGNYIEVSVAITTASNGSYRTSGGALEYDFAESFFETPSFNPIAFDAYCVNATPASATTKLVGSLLLWSDVSSPASNRRFGWTAEGFWKDPTGA